MNRAKVFENQKLVLGLAAVIIVIAGVLALTKWKITPRHLALSNSSTTNSSIMSNPLPFESVSTADVTGKHVRITTNKGDIVFALDPVAGPLAARNFYYLVQRGFYNGVVFHRVDRDLHIIQGGDPTGTGTGGPGYKFPDDRVTAGYTLGTVAMANSGPNTNGSQFFIMTGDQPGFAPNYSIFGHVTAGQDVANQIEAGDTMTSVTIESTQ